MGRTPNKNHPTPLKIDVTVPLLPHEYAWLGQPFVEPIAKPDGKRRPLGGLPRHVNWCIANYDQASGTITLDPVRFARTWHYLTSPTYGPSGPRDRLIRCFVPALRRIGRDPLPQWAVK